MILRFRCQDGTFRIEVQPSDDISVLYHKLLDVLPKTIEPQSILLSDKPANGSTRVLKDLTGQPVRDVGLNHGDMLFLSYETASTNGTIDSATANRISGKIVKPEEDVSESYTYTTNSHTSTKLNPWETINPDPVDEILDKQDGKIHRPKDQKMCRHGSKGMCDYCMPLEPGSQRLGYLYGRYAPYPEVPLGIKAIVEAIYEPPQRCESDGIALTLPWDSTAVDEVAALCGLRKVGVIFTDLTDDGTGKSTVVCKRHIDSYFLSSLEIALAAKLQANHPHPSKFSDTGYFGSNFITCVVSGNPDGGIDIFAYQASNTAVEMVRADIIEPSADPGLMLVRNEDDKDDTSSPSRYIPEVFYRRINEYGASIQENAKPAFPVDYLLVTLTHGFPTESKPTFIAQPGGFPLENREAVGVVQDIGAVARQLGVGKGGEVGVDVISDFHMLCFLHNFGILDKDEERLLAKVATEHDVNDAFALSQTGGWATLLTILQESGEYPSSSRTTRPFQFLPSAAAAASRKRRYYDEGGNDEISGLVDGVGGMQVQHSPHGEGKRLGGAAKEAVRENFEREVLSSGTGSGASEDLGLESVTSEERVLTKKMRRVSLNHPG
ncbi:nuclear protein localization protein 4 [Orbilia oligospora]|nr:nuclear protein localization protein 4 [Orbilia oligospora]